jgi:hypothetical protein
MDVSCRSLDEGRQLEVRNEYGSDCELCGPTDGYFYVRHIGHDRYSLTYRYGCVSEYHDKFEGSFDHTIDYMDNYINVSDDLVKLIDDLPIVSVE